MTLLGRAWSRIRGMDPRLVDALLVLVFTSGEVLEAALHHLAPVRMVPFLVTTVPLFWRRRFPIVSYLIQPLGLVLFDAPPLISMLVPVFFGTYSMSRYSVHRRRSAAVPVIQGALLAAVGIPLNFYTPAVPAWLAELVAGLGMWLAGNTVRGVEERARQLERERELVAQVAVAEEQARIARELHDVVAHSVSVMVVQAGAARRLMPGSPDRAAQALLAVESSGREALTELRQLLGVLRDQEGSGLRGGVPPSEQSDEAALTPQPRLAQLDALVERLRRTGLPVELLREGSPRPLPPGVELCAYRVVQEALTNALRHAGGPATRVLVRFGEDRLDLEIVNSPGQPATSDARGAGRGLLGMRQRVAACGGELEAGPDPAGGFAVRARLPLDPA